MSASNTLIGLSLAAGAACCFDGAVILQATEARAVSTDHGLKLSLMAQLARRRRWLMGTAVAILGWPLQLLALTFAPLTVVQPALALGSILLLTVGARVLKEPVGKREWICISILVLGVGLLALAAPPHTNFEPPVINMLLIAVPLVLLTSVPFLVGRKRSGRWILIISAGSAISLGALFSKLVTIELADDDLGLALVWAFCTAISAGFAFLVDMSALQRFEATRITPPIFVFETAIPVIAAPLILGEHWAATPGGGTLLGLGLLLVLIGGAGLAGGAKEIEKELGGDSDIQSPQHPAQEGAAPT